MYGIDNISKVLKLRLTENLRRHHEIYRLPCFGEYLEELINKSLVDEGLRTDWEPDRSHAISIDMTLDSGETISVKSGDYNPNLGKLKFSGSRLGQHSTIEEMLRAVESNAADYYVCVARIKKDWIPVPFFEDPKIYYLFIFASTTLGYSEHSWFKQETRNGGYNFTMQAHGIEAQIRSSMSHQLWTTASIELVNKPHQLVV